MEGILESKVYCSSCGRRTNHKILHSNKQEVDMRHINESIFTVLHTIISCAGCDNVSFAEIFSSDYVQNEITVYPEEPKVYRNIEQKIWSIIDSFVPKNIKDLYIQIVYSYNQKHNILCAVGLRTLIEAICLELKIIKGFKYDNNGKPFINGGKKESLEGKIYGLFEGQYIIWYQTLVLQRIREIGNAATHELLTPTSDELYSAIKIVETLIENIYELKNHELLKEET